MIILPVKNFVAAIKAPGPTHNQLALQQKLLLWESETHTRTLAVPQLNITKVCNVKFKLSAAVHFLKDWQSPSDPIFITKL